MLKRIDTSGALEKIRCIEGIAREIVFILSRIPLERSGLAQQISVQETVVFNFAIKDVKAFQIFIPFRVLPSAALELGRRVIECSTRLPKDWAFDVSEDVSAAETGSILVWSRHSIYVAFNPAGNFESYEIKISRRTPRKVRLAFGFGLLERPEVQTGIELPLRPGSGVLLGQICRYTFKKNNVIEVEIHLEQETPPFPVTLDLGALELSLDELSCLREGMKIEFALDEILQAVLRVGETPVAKGVLRIKENLCSFQVCETLSDENPVSPMSLTELPDGSKMQDLVFEE